jgi:hypothetical protein
MIIILITKTATSNKVVGRIGYAEQMMFYGSSRREQDYTRFHLDSQNCVQFKIYAFDLLFSDIGFQYITEILEIKAMDKEKILYISSKCLKVKRLFNLCLKLQK